MTLKAAATLDGKIADVHGTSRWITGEPARRQAHRMRAESDAIIVGVTDGAGATIRLSRCDSRRALARREPYRVVLDTHGRLSPEAR